MLNVKITVKDKAQYLNNYYLLIKYEKAIMVDGSFKCLGSVQHLKTKFGDGYTLTIKFNESQLNVSHFNNTNIYLNMILYELQTNISSECKLKERHFDNIYQFELPIFSSNDFIKRTKEQNGIFDLGSIYELIDTNKLRFNICDYSLSQNTLDNVFVNFVKEHITQKIREDILVDKESSDTEDDESHIISKAKNNVSKSSNSFNIQFPMNKFWN